MHEYAVAGEERACVSVVFFLESSMVSSGRPSATSAPSAVVDSMQMHFL